MARPHPYLVKLRALAASFPETAEVLTWGHPTFRVGQKIFASFGEHEGQPSIGCKSTHVDQAALIEDPGFFVPPYVGHRGWVGILADRVRWPLVADLVERSYRMIAPKRAAAALDAARGNGPAPAAASRVRTTSKRRPKHA